jgi:hypothetical protein
MPLLAGCPGYVLKLLLAYSTDTVQVQCLSRYASLVVNVVDGYPDE